MKPRPDLFQVTTKMTDPPAMRLDQFLQLSGIVGSGGQAKLLIQGGEILLNGDVETRRRRKLTEGDVVHFDGTDYPYRQEATES